MGGPGSGVPRGGRPTKLTRELLEEIVKLIEAGNYPDTASACCGVHKATFRKWMQRGYAQKTGLHREFRDRVKEAEAKAHASAVVRIRQFGGKTWQAEAWYLERKFPDKWGRWDRVSHDAHEGLKKHREDIRDKRTRDILDEAAAKLADIDASGDSGET